MSTALISQSDVIRIVPLPANESRLEFLQRHFGVTHFWVEPVSTDWLKSFSDLSNDDRDTERWDWYELSNGGAYMVPPPGSQNVHFKTPYYEGTVCREAAGIVACLHTFNSLAFHNQGKAFEKHYRWLRRFAARRADGIDILDASET